MIDVEKLRKLKGRRIYQFWLDEETGDITDVTSRDDVIQVIRCKDCKWFENIGCAISIVDDTDKPSEYDYCSFAERKEE